MARRSITFESAQGAIKSRSLVICRSNRKWMGSYIGTRFAVMINTAATLGASAREHGWYGMRAVRTGRRSGVWARTHRVAHDARHMPGVTRRYVLRHLTTRLDNRTENRIRNRTVRPSKSTTPSTGAPRHLPRRSL